MTYHFAAKLPEMGIGILSDSVVSFINKSDSWEKDSNNLKTFVISKYAVISCAGDKDICLEVVKNIIEQINDNSVFSDIAPLIQKTYIEVSSKQGFKRVAFILAARTKVQKSKTKLIKYVNKSDKTGLLRIESEEHYTIGLDLPNLEKELCISLTDSYKKTYGMEQKMLNLLFKANNIIRSPKSFPLGICFAAFMPIIKEYVTENNLDNRVGEPWTILLIPEDGEIHFQSSTMYDGSQSIMPNQV